MRVILAILVAGLLSGCHSPESDPAETGQLITVIENIDLLSMDNGEIQNDAVVVIDAAEIIYAGASSEYQIPSSANRIDGRGGVLAPGFVDAHVHIRHRSSLNVYPAYGVTTVFNMTGRPADIQLRDQINRGERFGPRIFQAGNHLESAPGNWFGKQHVATAEDARAVVRMQHEAGYDFLKIYDRIEGAHFSAALDEANKLNFPVLGHAARWTPIESVLEGGYAAYVHNEELLRYVDEDVEGLPELGGIAATIAASNTAVFPNLIAYRMFIEQAEDIDAHLALPEAKLVHPSVFQSFRPPFNSYTRRDDDWLERQKQRQELVRALAGELQEAGVLLLAGTDAEVSGFYPGWTMQEEIIELANAGLTPYEALAAATKNAGEFISANFNRELKIGKIAPGYMADFVLLGSNPLDNIMAVRDVDAVMLRGEWLDRNALNEKLDQQTEHYAKLEPHVLALEAAFSEGDVVLGDEIYAAARAAFPEEQFFHVYSFLRFVFQYLPDEGEEADFEKAEKAVIAAEIYADTFPEYHSAHYIAGVSHQSAGNCAEATAAFDRALDIHPFMPQAIEAKAVLADRCGD